MMKKKILLLALLLCFATMAMGAFVDNFDTAHDYLTSGLGNYDGIMNSGNATNLNASITAANKLRITGVGSWDGSTTQGPFLYKEVTGNFIAEIQVNAELYACGGLIVRLADVAAGGAGEDNMFLAYWPHSGWNVGSIFWYTNDGVRTERNNSGYNGGVIPSRFRVERQGANFYWSRSLDGVTWSAVSSGNPLVRTDMNVPTLQVGLAQTFGDWVGGDDVDFDYFIIREEVAELSGAAAINEEGQTSTTVTVDLTGPVHTAPVDVVIREVSADANDLLLNGVDAPLTLTFPVGTSQLTFNAQAIDDDLQEGPEGVVLKASISSTDANYDGNYGKSVTVNVADNDQGTLVIDQGDGLLVDEDLVLNDSFDVELSLPLAAAGTVTVNISTDGQAAVSPTQLTFTDLTWNVAQPITVTGLDDAVLENDPHNATISFSVSSADLAYAGNIVVPDITASVQENECGAWGYSDYDYNQDCKVDMSDLAQLASQWLQCTLPNAEGCIDER